MAGKKIVSIRRIDSRIEKVYEEEITFICPVRGKVTQKVKIRRLEYLGPRDVMPTIVSKDSLLDTLEGEIYSSDADDEITNLEDL